MLLATQTRGARHSIVSRHRAVLDLLETQPLNRIKLRCLASRIEAKQNSDAGGEQTADGKDFRRELGWHLKKTFNQAGGEETCKQTDQPSKQAQCDCFTEKLELDVRFRGSQGQSQPDLAGALGD